MKLRKSTIVLAGIAVLMLAAPMTTWAADYVPRILTGVIKAQSWTDENPRQGIYELTLGEDPQLAQVTEGHDPYLVPLGGAVYQDGMMYGIHFKQEWDPYDQAYTYTIINLAYDMNDWHRVRGQKLGSMYGNLISTCGLTRDPVTGQNFGIFYNFNMNNEVIDTKLATIDFVNTEASGAPRKQIVGKVEGHFVAIAAADNGLLYAVGKDGWLYVVDKVLEEEATLVMTYPLADLGIADISNNPSSMTIDPRTKKMYWSYVSNAQKSFLYEIEDYQSLAPKARRLMQVPDNAWLVNMFIAPMTADDDAPAAVSGLTADFTGELTRGTVAFTMPTTTYGGDMLSGALTYTVYADGEQVATGEAQAGEQVTKQVTVNSPGKEVELRVTATNSVGEGVESHITRYIGRDKPLPVSNLRLNYNNDTEYARLTWEEPTHGVRGIGLTPANLSYLVVRQPDGVVVADGLKLPAFGEKLSKTDELKSYYYEVVVQNGTQLSDTARSNNIVVGQALVPPFFEDFTTQQGFDRFTVVDANTDGVKPQYSDWRNTWVRFHKVYTYSGTVSDHAMINNYNQADDYLLTPPLQLEKGGSYELRLTAKKGYSDKRYDQKMRVLVGPAGEDLADYVVVKDTFDIDDVNLMEFMANVDITADGIYQLALHCVSNANSGELYVDELHLAASLAASAPAAVENLTAQADKDGYLRATVTFNAPTKTLHGDELTAISHIDGIDTEGHVLGTLLNPVPGSRCTLELEGLTNGINTYYVLAYAGEDAGAKTAFELFAGQDYPTEPTNILLADDGKEAVLSWEAPAEGLNGLKLNPDLLTFNLYTINDDGYPALLQKDIRSPHHTGVATNTGEQQLLYYALDAQNSAGYSELVATNSLVVGEPYQLPYHDGFDGQNRQFVWIEGEYADWNIGRVTISADGDGYAMAFEPNRADYGIYNLGKLSLKGAARPTLTFSYYAIPTQGVATLAVTADVSQTGKPDVLCQIDYGKETKEGWKTVEVDLSKYIDSNYVILGFAMVSLRDNAEPVTIVFDDLHIVADSQSGIEAPHSIAATDSPRHCYDLQGRRIADGKMNKGIYICGDRKAFKK